MTTNSPILAANASDTIPLLEGIRAIAILLVFFALRKRLQQKIDTDKSTSEKLSVVTS